MGEDIAHITPEVSIFYHNSLAHSVVLGGSGEGRVDLLKSQYMHLIYDLQNMSKLMKLLNKVFTLEVTEAKSCSIIAIP